MGGLKLLKFLSAIQLIRDEVDPDMTLSQLMALLTIAKDEGLSVSEVQRRSSLTQTTGSRIVRSLAGINETGKAGYNLVEMRTDPHDSRRRVIHLNGDGREVIKNIVNQL